MKRRLFEFVCPHCKASFYLARDTYLIGDENSTEYRRLKDGSYFMHQCQSCRQLFPLEYPLIYRDGKGRFTLVCSDKPADEFSGSIVLTRDSRQFLEAFSILDRSLPLREVLIAKRRYEKMRGNPVKIVDGDAGKRILWVEDKGELVGIGY